MNPKVNAPHVRTYKTLLELYRMILKCELQGRAKFTAEEQEQIAITRFHLELTSQKLAEKGVSSLDF